MAGAGPDRAVVAGAPAALGPEPPGAMVSDPPTVALRLLRVPVHDAAVRRPRLCGQRLRRHVPGRVRVARRYHGRDRDRDHIAGLALPDRVLGEPGPAGAGYLTSCRCDRVTTSYSTTL